MRMALGAQSRRHPAHDRPAQRAAGDGRRRPGVALAYVAGRSMEALLAGVTPADAPTLAAAVCLAALMTIVGSAAADAARAARRSDHRAEG